jgi:glycosyltransferase involved in cell wall biosynthesis
MDAGVARVRLVLLAHYHELFAGAEWCLDELIRGIRIVGPDVELHVVVPRAGELSARYPALGVKVHVIPNQRWADFTPYGPERRVAVQEANALAADRLTALLHDVKPVAAITNTMTVPALAVAARRANVPHLWVVHEFGDELHFLHGYEQTMRRIGELSRLVICNSEAVRGALAGPLGSVPTEVVYGGVDVPGDVPVSATHDGGPLRVVLVGRMCDAKGQAVAIRALASARKQGADVALRLVGQCDPGAERQLKDSAAQLGVEGHVAITPRRVDPWPIYASSHVALVCSKREPFGRVTVEAQKCGLAVCASRSGGTPEIVEHEVTGLLHDYGDAETLARDLTRLAVDERLRRHLGLQARATALRRFDVPAYANRMLALAS